MILQLKPMGTNPGYRGQAAVKRTGACQTSRSLQRRGTWTLPAVLLLLSFWTCFSLSATTATVLDRVVASVNGEAISESDLGLRTKLLMLHQTTDNQMPPLETLQKQLLEQIILERLQLGLASTEELAVPDRIIDRSIADIAAQDQLSTEAFESFLKDQEIPWEKFRAWIRTELILAKVQQREIAPLVHISKADMEQFLRSPAGQDQIGTEYRIGHILIAMPDPPHPEAVRQARTEALALVQSLKQGANFSKMAMQKSASQQALAGGDLGWLNTASIPSLFANIVPNLKIHAIEGPIEDSSGFHIIQLIDKKHSETKPADLKERAMEALYKRQFQEQLNAWLRQLRADSDVEIYLHTHDAP